MRKLAIVLRKARESKELNQIQAAAKAKMSVNYLRLIESGSPAYVSEKVALRLVKAIGAPKGAVMDLLEGQKVEAYKAAKERAKARQKAAKRTKVTSKKATKKAA